MQSVSKDECLQINSGIRWTTEIFRCSLNLRLLKHSSKHFRRPCTANPLKLSHL